MKFVGNLMFLYFWLFNGHLLKICAVSWRVWFFQELAAAKKAKVVAGRSCREQALFYSTSLLAVVAMSAGSSLLFLVPLYVDPAISTLASNFVTEPVTCITTRREELMGLANCSWSSCREGCTSDAYHCTHIYVSYNDSKVRKIN